MKRWKLRFALSAVTFKLYSLNASFVFLSNDHSVLTDKQGFEFSYSSSLLSVTVAVFWIDGLVVIFLRNCFVSTLVLSCQWVEI